MDLIFPVRCVGCGKFGDYICRGCLGTIAIKKNFECIGCKRNIPFGQTCFLCAKTNSVDQLLIVADYKNPLVEKSLKFLKYKFISDLERPLAILMKKYLKWLTLDKKYNVFEANPLLIPVPLHPKRLNWRGFNQAELIARLVADNLKLTIRTNLVTRIKATAPQVSLSRWQRQVNLRQAFVVKSKAPKSVLIVDDVWTSGATVKAVAKALRKAGSKTIWALTLAR